MRAADGPCVQQRGEMSPVLAGGFTAAGIRSTQLVIDAHIHSRVP